MARVITVSCRQLEDHRAGAALCDRTEGTVRERRIRNHLERTSGIGLALTDDKRTQVPVASGAERN
jgi:hypothetical protein